MVLGLFDCSCDSAVRLLDIEKSSQRRLLLYLAPRRVHLARPWTQASKPALTLVWPRRDVPRRFMWYIFQSSIRAHHDDLQLLCVCSLVWYVGTKDARWVRCSSWSLGPSPRPPTASCYSVAAELRGDCVRATWLSNASIVTRKSVCIFCCCTRFFSVTFLLD